MAKGEQPTLEQQMSAIKGFSTVNGEVVDSVTDSAEEKQAQLQTDAANDTARKAARAAPVKLMTGTDTEVVAPADDKTADNDKAAAGDDGGKADGEDGDGEDTSDDDTKTVTMAEAKKMMARAASKRIGEIKKANRTALAAEASRNDALERRLAVVEGRNLTDKKQGATQEADPDVEPKSSDFEYGELDTRFIRALARYETRQELKTADTNQRNTAKQQDAEREAAEFVEKRTAVEEAGEAKYDDYDEVVTQTFSLPFTDPAAWPLSDTLGKLALNSKVGADLLYHLASHPDEARKTFRLSPLEQAAYFGRKEAEFTSKADANSKQQQAGGQQQVRVTKAPAPPANQRVRGSGGNNQASPATTDFKAFEAQAMGALRRR